jgi:hypothetical protein
MAYLLPRQFRHLNDSILKSQADFELEINIAVENGAIAACANCYPLPPARGKLIVSPCCRQ